MKIILSLSFSIYFNTLKDSYGSPLTHNIFKIPPISILILPIRLISLFYYPSPLGEITTSDHIVLGLEVLASSVQNTCSVNETILLKVFSSDFSHYWKMSLICMGKVGNTSFVPTYNHQAHVTKSYLTLHISNFTEASDRFFCQAEWYHYLNTKVCNLVILQIIKNYESWFTELMTSHAKGDFWDILVTHWQISRMTSGT